MMFNMLFYTEQGVWGLPADVLLNSKCLDRDPPFQSIGPESTVNEARIFVSSLFSRVLILNQLDSYTPALHPPPCFTVRSPPTPQLNPTPHGPPTHSRLSRVDAIAVPVHPRRDIEIPLSPPRPRASGEFFFLIQRRVKSHWPSQLLGVPLHTRHAVQ
jgi:hypothetical protein